MIYSLDLKDNVVVIMNTNKRRELADSKYGERQLRRKAVEEPNRVVYRNPGWVGRVVFDEYSYLIEDENRLKRVNMLF